MKIPKKDVPRISERIILSNVKIVSLDSEKHCARKVTRHGSPFRFAANLSKSPPYSVRRSASLKILPSEWAKFSIKTWPRDRRRDL